MRCNLHGRLAEVVGRSRGCRQAQRSKGQRCGHVQVGGARRLTEDEDLGDECRTD